MIKGRGDNSGKYLRRAWLGGGKPWTVLWVDRQKDADRFQHHEVPYAVGRSGGQRILLVAPPAIRARVDELREFVAAHATGAAAAQACYWVSGTNDCANDYCRPCGVRRVRALRRARPAEAAGISLDGGWSMEHDTSPTCRTCGATVDGTLTEYGADEELDHFTEHPPAWRNPAEWAAVGKALTNLDDSDPRWRKVARWVDAARAAEQLHAARAALLGVLLARTQLPAALRDNRNGGNNG